MRLPALCLLIALAPLPALSEPVTARNGSDSYLAGAADLPVLEAPGDVFAAGSSVVLRGTTSGDVHAAGFSIEVEVPVPQDLYAMGGSVTVRGPVGSDVTAAGFSLRVAGEVGGNARLMGGSVVVDAPVRGALTATGGEVTLNAEIGGDVLVQTGRLTLGPQARIGGRLVYSAPEAARIPAEVVPAERVSFRAEEPGDGPWREAWAAREYPVLPGVMTMLSGALLVWGFLLLIGAGWLLIAPDLTERLRQGAAARPGPALLAGFLGMATLFGLVPVSAITLIGIPLIPFALLAILLLWTFGYLLAAYVLAHRVLLALGGGIGVAGRLLALAAVLLGLGLLNFIPFLGWMLNVALMLFGLGAILRPVFARLGAPLPAAEFRDAAA